MYFHIDSIGITYKYICKSYKVISYRCTYKHQQCISFEVQELWELELVDESQLEEVQMKPTQ